MLSKQAADLLLRHPGLLIVETPDELLLRGLVKNKEKNYHINMSCPNFPMLKDLKMLVRDKFIVRKFTDKSAIIANNNLWTVTDLINNLDGVLLSQANDLNADMTKTLAVEDEANALNAINNNNKENINKNNNNETESVEKYYAEIAALHKPHLYDIQLNLNCTLIRFCKFLANEQQYLEIELPSLQIRAHSLPECLKLQELFTKCESLTSMIEKFQKFIEDLQPFYENFSVIDELCHVLQPANPTTKHNFRLFVLNENVFLKLEIIDPLNPLSSMSVHIIGPTTEVEKFRHIYSEGIKDWDPELDIQKNLLRIFDLCYFPMPPEDNNMVEQQYCNICYSYRLDETETAGGCDVPVVSCDNPQCTLVFHYACLLKWFRTLTDNISFLNMAIGECPFCKAKLSTSFNVLCSSDI